MTVIRKVEAIDGFGLSMAAEPQVKYGKCLTLQYEK